MGDLLTHEQLEATIGTARNGARYRTVLAAFRRNVETDLNLVLGADPGRGLKVLTDSERVGCGVGKVRSSGRAIVRATTLVSGADRRNLGAEDAARADHVGQLANRIMQTMRTQAKELRLELVEVKRLSQ